MYDTPILDVSTANPGTNAVTSALSIPTGIVVKAILNVVAGALGYPYLSSLNNADMAPSQTLAPLMSSPSGTLGSQVQVFTNTASQIRYRMAADTSMYIVTLGWEDSL
jgi:hypothetical protein